MRSGANPLRAGEHRLARRETDVLELAHVELGQEGEARQVRPPADDAAEAEHAERPDLGDVDHGHGRRRRAQRQEDVRLGDEAECKRDGERERERAEDDRQGLAGLAGERAPASLDGRIGARMSGLASGDGWDARRRERRRTEGCLATLRACDWRRR